jgi:hypothetical protein
MRRRQIGNVLVIGAVATTVGAVRLYRQRRMVMSTEQASRKGSAAHGATQPRTVLRRPEGAAPRQTRAVTGDADYRPVAGSDKSDNQPSSKSNFLPFERDQSHPSNVDDPCTPTQGTGKREPSFIKQWVVPLLVVAVSFGLASWLIWQGGLASSDREPQVRGGLLLFVAAPQNNDIEASVAAVIHPTGYEDISLLNLTLTFNGVYPGLRWFIAASGQYNPHIDTELNAFCDRGGRASRTANTINCQDNDYDGSVDVKYDFADHIGSLNGRQIRQITDSMDGYLDSDAVVASGTLAGNRQWPPSSAFITAITLPVHTLTVAHLGSDEYFAYPPIAIFDRGDIGVGSTLGEIATVNDVSANARFADSSTRLPVNYLRLSSVTLAIDVGTRVSELSWASPPTAQIDQLKWRSTREGFDGVRFTLHDPFAANRLSRNDFIAGIFASIAASALLLLLERLIERRTDQAQNKVVADRKSASSAQPI